jgi:hypothetical protein
MLGLGFYPLSPNAHLSLLKHIGVNPLNPKLMPKRIGIKCMGPKLYLIPKPDLLQIISHFGYKSLGICFIK